MKAFSAREFKTGIENGIIFPEGIHSIIFASKDQEESMLSFNLEFTKMAITVFPSSIVLSGEDGRTIRLEAVESIKINKSVYSNVSRIKVWCGDALSPTSGREYTLLVF